MDIAVISVHGCPCIPPGGLDAGGMNVYVRETSKELRNLGHSVTAFSREHVGSASGQAGDLDEFELVHLRAGEPRLQKVDISGTLLQFTDQLLNWISGSRRSFDVIAAHYWFSGLAGASVADALGLPLVFSFHTMASMKLAARDAEEESDERLTAERQIAARADRIVAWTVEEAMHLQADYEVQDCHVKVSAPGVDCVRFAPMPQHLARSQLGIPDIPTLLYVGRLDAFKGIDLLLDSFAEVRETVQRVQLIVAGDGDDQQRADFRCSVSRLGLADSLHWLGAVPQGEMPALYSAADLMLVPSFHETFGLAALEAAACGLPVVAADVDGLRAIVIDGETGHLAKTREPSEWAVLTTELLADDGLRHRMSLESRRGAERRTWNIVAEDLVEIYGEVVESRV